MKYNVFFGFRNGKLITVVLSTQNEYDDAVDCDYHIDEPQEAKKQVEEWLRTLS